MNWPEFFEQTAQQMAAHAMRKGWWQWARYEVQAMEAQPHGEWQGLRSRVGEIVKAAGFKPDPCERALMEPSREVHSLQ